MVNDPYPSFAAGAHSRVAASMQPRTLAVMLGIAAIYFVAAKLGLSMAMTAEQVSAVWPPTGIALAAILILGYRIWPGIWLGAFMANATANEPLGTAIGVALGNTLEAIVGAWLLQWIAFDKTLERLKDVFGLIVLAAIISTTISATIGVLSLCLGNVHPWASFASLWSVWWLGDAMGTLIVAPLVLTWAAPPSFSSRRRTAEAVALALGLVTVGLMVFNAATALDSAHYSLVYTVFPFVIWAAIRFGQRGTTAVTCVAWVFAIWGAMHGVGPFESGTTQDRLISMQGFLGIVAVTGLLLAASLAERKLDEERKRVLHAVTQILAESSTLAEATPQIIQRICSSLSWHLGAIWEVDREAVVLRCAGVWHVGSATFPAFQEATKQRTFEIGVGLPGRVWASGEPAWIPDVVHDANFPRARVAFLDGLHTAFGFPIRLGGDVHGVIEFFSPQIRQPDADLLRMMSTIGIQIGQFIERRHGEEEVRRSEALKRAVLESALDAIITMDHVGTIVEFNPAAEKMFGWTRSHAVGKPLVDLIIPPSLKEKHRQGMANYLATGIGPALDKRLDLYGLRSDGTEFPIELTVSRIPFPGPPVFTGYIRDITERKRLEDELRGRADQLLAADHRKNEFLATLAHELRNPLAPIHNGLQILRLSQGDPEVMAQARAMMERQLAQMVRLVDDLLDLSRISSGKFELRRERIELGEIVEQAVETSLPIIEQAGHQLTVDVPAGVYVDADLTRMAQVFSNILNNAAKYTEPGGNIRLIARRHDSEAVVSVKDNGIGIPPHMLPNVFDIFTQVDRDLERSQGGLGIGLSIVRRLVEMHGGSVEARSDGYNKGSEFIVRLPVELSLQPHSDEGAPVRFTGRRRVLVVDDNQDVANSLSMMLRLLGNESKTANDGMEALEVAAAFRPDLILLDIGMPRLNGYDTARQIRQQPWGKNILLVAVTGWGQDNDRRKSHDAGFDSHIVKPIELETIEELLASSASPRIHGDTSINA